MATGMKLWWGSGSFFAWRAMITLEEKALAYESHQISFSAREHKSEEYMKINPRGQIPSFKDGDVTICESGAICEYLESVYSSGTKLMPEDPKLKAQVFQYMWEGNNLYPVCRPLMFADGTEEQKEALRKELKIWDKHVEGKTFLVGDAFTLADVFLFPQFATFYRFGLDFEKAGLPNLAKYYDGLKDRPTIKKTWPPHWLEGAGNGRLASI